MQSGRSIVFPPQIIRHYKGFGVDGIYKNSFHQSIFYLSNSFVSSIHLL